VQKNEKSEKNHPRADDDDDDGDDDDHSHQVTAARRLFITPKKSV